MVQTRPFAKDDAAVQSLSLALTYEPPNKHFDHFIGRSTVKMGGDSSEFAVDGKSLLMRETNLRSCDL